MVHEDQGSALCRGMCTTQRGVRWGSETKVLLFLVRWIVRLELIMVKLAL